MPSRFCREEKGRSTSSVRIQAAVKSEFAREEDVLEVDVKQVE